MTGQIRERKARGGEGEGEGGELRCVGGIFTCEEEKLVEVYVAMRTGPLISQSSSSLLYLTLPQSAEDVRVRYSTYLLLQSRYMKMCIWGVALPKYLVLRRGQALYKI